MDMKTFSNLYRSIFRRRCCDCRVNCDRQVFSIAPPLNIHNGYYAQNTGGSQVHLAPLLQNISQNIPKFFVRIFLCPHKLTFIAFLFQRATQYSRKIKQNGILYVKLCVWSTIFTWPLLPEGLSLQEEIPSVCLSVFHRFNISNIGPSNHPRIKPDPTLLPDLPELPDSPESTNPADSPKLFESPDSQDLLVYCCYYISLLPGWWNIDDNHRNTNTNTRDNLDG